MGFLKPKQPPIVPNPPVPTANQARTDIQNNRFRPVGEGFSSTVATSPLGIEDGNTLTTRKVLGFG